MRNTRLCATVLAAVLFASVSVSPVKGQNRASGQADAPVRKNGQPQTASDPDSVSKRPLELFLLIGDLRSTFPEFSADMLITMAESEKVVDKDWKKELLDEAFHAASWAQYPIPKKAVGPYPMDTQYGYLSEAFKLKLDALSLQCRVVSSMVGLDKAKARELFSEIGKLKFAALTCSEGLVYEVSGYYTTAAKLAQQAFVDEEMRGEDRLQFLESLVLDISSPVQIAPVANLIHSMKLSRPHREMLVGSLASVLRKTKSDDRSFSGSIYTVGQEMEKLYSVCKMQGISTSELTAALREYYVRHYSAERCSDTLRNTGDTGPLPLEVSEFNKRLLALDDAKVFAIEADEIKPSQIKGGVDVRIYWQTPPSSEIMRSYKRLRFRSGGTPFVLNETETDEWKLALSNFLDKMSAWKKGDKESNEEYFHQKCLQFEGLLFGLHPWPERDKVVEEYVDFLDNFDLKHGSRIEWFWHANRLVGELGRPSGSEAKPNLTRQLLSSKNPVLYRYSQMRKTLSEGVKREAARR